MDSQTFRYKSALTFADLLIRHLSPIPLSGKTESIALMYDMNVLFESYIEKCLQQSAAGTSSIVKSQPVKLFWEEKTIRPDFVVTKQKRLYPIDTKWKILESRSPGDSDLKQMYVYNHYYSSSLSLLVYPKAAQTETLFGNFSLPKVGSDKLQVHSCALIFIDLFKEDGQLRSPKAVGDELIAMLS